MNDCCVQECDFDLVAASFIAGQFSRERLVIDLSSSWYSPEGTSPL